MADDLPQGFRVVPASNGDLPVGFKVISPDQTDGQRWAALGSNVADVANSARQGVHEGFEGLVGQFGDIPNALGDIVNKIVGYVGSPEDAKQAGEAAKSGADIVSGLPTYGLRTAYGWANDLLTGSDTTTPIASPTSADVNTAVNAINGAENYQPTTPLGGATQTVSSFVPAAVAFGGISPENIVRAAVIPGVASEAAGQATKGSEYEGTARFLGALLGNFAPAAATAFRAPENVLRGAVGDPSKINWQAARDLERNTTGIKLSGPESIAQTSEGGGAGLLKMLRTVEGSNTGGAVTAPFFAKRPAQVDQAVNSQLLDAIAPQSATPSVLGTRAAQSANSVLDDAQRAVNAETRHLYQAAEPQLIPENRYMAIQSDPRFRSALERLRNNPDLASDYANMSDRSLAVVDAVTKDMAARGEALANVANPLYGPELAARNAQGAANAREVARDVSPAYEVALERQAQMRRERFDPLEAGPVGQVARATTTDTAGAALLPASPHVGGHIEIGDAVARLLQADAGNTRQLVRQNLADRYSTAATETQAGNREWAGAKYVRDLAGNQAKEETLGAVLGALNLEYPSELINVLRATGRRLQPGSPTAANTALNADIAGPNSLGRILGAPKNLVTSLITNTGDAVNRARLGKGVSFLADQFVSANAVDLIKAIVERGPTPIFTQAAARGTVQGLPQGQR